MPARKIATCCYCGTRAALVLDTGRHELTCANCGAPLHDLRHLPLPARSEAKHDPRRPTPRPTHPKAHKAHRKRPKKTRKPKRSKALWGEIWDVIEDILD